MAPLLDLLAGMSKSRAATSSAESLLFHTATSSAKPSKLVVSFRLEQSSATLNVQQSPVGGLIPRSSVFWKPSSR